MTGSFVKIYGAMMHSSIWCEPSHVRILWVTMLMMADAEGVVEASLGGLAHQAHLTREETQDALETLLGPDEDSRDGTTGERIRKVDGGWEIINHGKYRDRRTKTQVQAAERMRRYRAKNRERHG